MPADLWTDAVRMGGCGLTVAAVAVPLGLAAWIVSRRQGVPLLPRPQPWRVPWTGFELLILFPITSVAPLAFIDPLLVQSGFYPAIYGVDAPDSALKPMRQVWAAAVFFPIWAILLFVTLRSLYPGWRVADPLRLATLASRFAVGTRSWLIIHPPILLVHLLVMAAFWAFEWKVEEHPLAKAFREPRPMIDQILLFVQASIATPIVEEVLFRGLLLPWLLGRADRVPLTLGMAVALAVALGLQRVDAEGINFSHLVGPAGFAAALVAGWVAVRSAPRLKRPRSGWHRLPAGAGEQHRLEAGATQARSRQRRTLGAIHASAALFAVVHSSVWPTPIPLFVLGLGLGWLAVRTRGVIAPAIVHGLFNAVSVLFVLRGG